VGHALLDQYLTALANAGGSDLHVKVGSPPRIRVNGTLQRIPGAEPVTPAVTAEMAQSIMRDDVREHFDATNEADFAYAITDVGRFRANAFRQRGSTALVFRLVRGSAVTLDELGMPPVLERLAGEHRGLVLVTGPTGSGKTTTLAAMIDWINRNRELHVITIEDPIEVLHNDVQASVNQREIGVDTSSFANAMRAAMRQDPDVILVGEMRDQETVAAALSAAETGHHVLSTLHTIDASETINRIVDFFPPHQQNQIRVALAGSLRGIVCQRLVPTADGIGRVAAIEVMVNNGRTQNCILNPELTGEIHDIIADGEFYGMRTFDQSLIDLLRAGRITLRQAMSAASNPHDMKLAMEKMGGVPAPV
jgi:twitching motility protein PilT